LISSFEKIVVSNQTLYWLNILDSERKNSERKTKCAWNVKTNTRTTKKAHNSSESKKKGNEKRN